MPLHDWTNLLGWDGVHLLWIAELARWLKPRLPTGYRVYVGTAPVAGIGAWPGKPDVFVNESNGHPAPSPAGSPAPDGEGLAVAIADVDRGVFVEHAGGLVAAVELVSPANKDRPASRVGSVARYAGYLRIGVHLLLVDVHPRPLGFSFADAIEADVKLETPGPLPAPQAVAYRVGEPFPGQGRLTGYWRRPLAVGQPLPELALPITLDYAVPIDLEGTYSRAAADAYLD